MRPACEAGDEDDREDRGRRQDTLVTPRRGLATMEEVAGSNQCCKYSGVAQS